MSLRHDATGDSLKQGLIVLLLLDDRTTPWNMELSCSSSGLIRAFSILNGDYLGLWYQDTAICWVFIVASVTEIVLEEPAIHAPATKGMKCMDADFSHLL